jgi:hypothetical protein
MTTTVTENSILRFLEYNIDVMEMTGLQPQQDSTMQFRDFLG